MQVLAYVDRRHAVDGAKLITIFREFDKNKDGVFTPAEYGAALAKMGLKLKAGDLDLLIEDLDKDANGHIEFNEWAGKVLERHDPVMKGTSSQSARRALM